MSRDRVAAEPLFRSITKGKTAEAKLLRQELRWVRIE